MTDRLETARSEPCVWMSAGVLSYRLCNRNFDCEHCPLYAAIMGVARDADAYCRANGLPERRFRGFFPDDRLYGGGHAWLKAMDQHGRHFQFGLDSLVSTLIPAPRHVRWTAAPRALRRGETICILEFDDGILSVGAPSNARLSDRNSALDDDPEAIISEPYGNGWIGMLSHVQKDDLAQFVPANAAKERARLDLRRLRRRVAFHLLVDEGDVALRPTDVGELSVDPGHELGGAGYLELMRELVH